MNTQPGQRLPGASSSPSASTVPLPTRVPGVATASAIGTMLQRTGYQDAPENNLEVSTPAAHTMRHCSKDPGYRGPLPTLYQG